MSKEVIVYSKQPCSGCDFTKQWLKEHHIPFEERRIDLSPDAMQRIVDLGFMGVPVVEVSGEAPWAGVNVDRLQGLLDKNGTSS